MKKFTFIFLLNLSICSCLMAQVSVGVKTGGALANHVYGGIGLTGDGNSDNLKFTYLGGLFASVPLSENLILQPEVLYNNKGFRRGTPNQNFLLHYLSVPIMVQYHILNKLTAELGPEISYLMNAGVSDLPVNLSPDLPLYEELLLSSYRDLDIALNLGVGYFLSDRWHLNLRYNMGLYDVSEDFTIPVVGQDEPVLISGHTYNRSLQLSVGYRIF